MGSSGLSPAAIVAIACNSVAGLLILILFVILYKACKVPSRPEKPPVLAMGPEQQIEHKYLLAKPREDVFSQYISQLGELS